MTTTDAAFQAWLATPEGQAAVNAGAGDATSAPTDAVTATTTETAAGDGPVPASTPAAAAPAPAVAPIDYTQLAQALVAAGAVPTAEATAPAPAQAKDPVPNNLFQKGSIVVHEWDDDYDGPSKRYGIVIATYPDTGSGASSSIAWFEGPSGPIGDQYLTAV